MCVLTYSDSAFRMQMGIVHELGKMIHLSDVIWSWWLDWPHLTMFRIDDADHVTEANFIMRMITAQVTKSRQTIFEILLIAINVRMYKSCSQSNHRLQMTSHELIIFPNSHWNQEKNIIKLSGHSLSAQPFLF